jgi:hypothetical protein
VLSQGREQAMPSVFIQGRNIRYVPIPDFVDPMETIRAHVCHVCRDGRPAMV